MGWLWRGTRVGTSAPANRKDKRVQSREQIRLTSLASSAG